MYADAHVDACLDVARTEKSVGGIYNVSPGNPITHVELAKKLSLITRFKGEITFGSYPPGYPQRPQPRPAISGPRQREHQEGSRLETKVLTR
jgi:nucleoside-diphosphate-sugar epimerase